MACLCVSQKCVTIHVEAGEIKTKPLRRQQFCISLKCLNLKHTTTPGMNISTFYYVFMIFGMHWGMAISDLEEQKKMV